ncbi:MAG: LuxR C-terminal-related transcriptional regulator [Candidatus Phocaeicola excrementipullorum]|uniref:LuxR C-terminal-related transcriptional regulator n=1 Tax=Candidatus Phocaeicola excrementipullorum TaxID=2838731 RepID=A0A948TL84_9BACT|nr:LuxR C-terminal-related transcriptional regulator [Candidatus Phocaeicola excrementipullorum]
MKTASPEVAILEQNTLTALGLQTILEEMIPNAVIRTFSSFGQLIDDTPDMYAHYFVSANIYFAHTAFFLERRPKCIVLTAGEQPLLNGIPTLNICMPQERLVKAIMMLRKTGHESMHRPLPEAADELTPREIEVLVLLTKGLINKEIAEKLHISLTTVISHRKNITEKLGIKSASGLAIYAVMHGYIDADSI